MGKKNKNKGSKGQSIDLGSLLADAPAPAGAIDLPSAPRSSMGTVIDESKLPTRPPYTAFLGNLPYEIQDADIEEYFENRKLKVLNVRIPRSQDGTDRIKGFGYAEFESVEALKEAVLSSGGQLLNRPVRIDLAGNRDDDRGGFGDFEKSRAEEDSDWRSSKPAGGGGFGDRDRGGGGGGFGERRGGFGGDRYGDRGDRDGGFERRGPPPSRADEEGQWTRGVAMPGPPPGESRGGYGGGGGGDRYGDRGGGDRYGDRGGGDRYGDRGGGGYERRAPPPSRSDEESQWTRGAAPPARDPAFDPPAPRGGGGRFGGDRDRDQDREGGYERERRGPPPSRADGESQWSRGAALPPRDPDAEAPATRGGGGAPPSRPRLNLQRRSKPVESAAASGASSSSKSNPFGSAKPVDTASKLAEVESKIEKPTFSTRKPTPRDADLDAAGDGEAQAEAPPAEAAAPAAVAAASPTEPAVRGKFALLEVEDED